MTKLRRFKVEKLIRDGIPKKLAAEGIIFHGHRLDDEPFKKALFAKLAEEVDEVASAKDNSELVEEMADVLECLVSLAELINIKFDEVEQARIEKKNKRGGFEKRFYGTYLELSDTHQQTFSLDYVLARPEKYPEILPDSNPKQE